QLIKTKVLPVTPSWGTLHNSSKNLGKEPSRVTDKPPRRLTAPTLRSIRRKLTTRRGKIQHITMTSFVRGVNHWQGRSN
ncbi:AAEL011153-PA, partial [Aedes aegypti]